MEQNEPTTGEIVRLLSETRDDPYDLWATKSHRCQLAIDRLESQARELSDKDMRIKTLTEKVEALENDAINYDMNLSEMTARAESAEAELLEYRKRYVKETYHTA